MARTKNRPKIGKPRLRIVGAGYGKSLPDLEPNDRKYFGDLHLIIDQIYTQAADVFQWTWNQLAAHANLGYGTVCNLGERQTKYPRYQTIYKLARAVGWTLVVQSNKTPKIKSAAG